MTDGSQTQNRTYLGMPVHRPRVAFFELTSCEGCQLQIVNNEATLLDFLSLVTVVNFREAMTEKSDDYDIAFVEGSVTRADEIERLAMIRKNAKVLVAFGSCACFGGVNQLKNRFKDPDWVKKQVYGDHPIETNDRARPLEDFVPVDLRIYGCPVKKEEVEKIVTNIVLGKNDRTSEISGLHGVQGEREHLPLRSRRTLPGADHARRLRLLVPQQPVRLLGMPRSC